MWIWFFGLVAVAGDVEIAVVELGHERWQHGLEAEAAAKARVVDMIAQHREQIDDSAADRVELRLA